MISPRDEATMMSANSSSPRHRDETLASRFELLTGRGMRLPFVPTLCNFQSWHTQLCRRPSRTIPRDNDGPSGSWTTIRNSVIELQGRGEHGPSLRPAPISPMTSSRRFQSFHATNSDATCVLNQYDTLLSLPTVRARLAGAN